MQLLLERAVANLLQNICVPRLVDLECFATVGADDFISVRSLLSVVAQWVISAGSIKPGFFFLGVPTVPTKRKHINAVVGQVFQSTLKSLFKLFLTRASSYGFTTGYIFVASF